MYDVMIIGAGVTGAACARELSKYELSICVIEKEDDVCCGTSKANSGIVHAGFDAKVGSLMAQMNVEGNKMMSELAKTLEIPFIQNGSLIIGKDKDSIQDLENLYEKGIENGVEGLEIITDKDRIIQMEPNLVDNVEAVLYAPTAGIICPFELNLAMAEHAKLNGVDFQFNTEVLELKQKNGAGNSSKEIWWEVTTKQGTYETRFVVNAAGVYAGVFHNMVSRRKVHITPRKGEYLLLDKSAGNHVKHTIFSLPTKLGKGILVTPTVHGNLLVGPTACDIEDKDGVETSQEGLLSIVEKSTGEEWSNVKGIPLSQVITSFAGLRAHEDNHDFIIEELEDAKGFIDCAGIESPGLTSSSAIGRRVAGIVKDRIRVKEKVDYIPTRQGFLRLDEMTWEERNILIKEQSLYGNIICRCEMISEGEILEAIHRPLGAKSLDGVKRRVRATAGRCQGGFCTPKIIEIISRELKIDKLEVTKSGGKSKLLMGVNKET